MKDTKPLSKEGLDFWKEVVEPATRPPKPKAPTLVWRVICETGTCRYRQDRLDTRNEAIGRGRLHVHNHHADVEEWEFRIQGIKHG